MYHPLSPDLTKLTDDELTARLNNLTKRMRQAANQPQYDQLQVFLMETFAEQDRRKLKEAWERQQEEEQRQKEGGKDPFEGLIDV